MSNLYLDLSPLEVTLISSGSLKINDITSSCARDNEVAKREHDIEINKLIFPVAAASRVKFICRNTRVYSMIRQLIIPEKPQKTRQT